MPVPITLDDLGDGKSWDFDLDVRSASTSVYAKLGVSAVVSSQAAWDSTTASWEMMVGVRQPIELSKLPENRVIYETFWGIGLRVLLTAKTTEVGLDVNTGMVAAQAEYGSASVQYEARGIGLGPDVLADLLESVPPFGTFDLETQAALAKVRETLKKVIREQLRNDENTLARLQPVLVKLLPQSSPQRDDLGDAAVYNFSMRKIAAGLSYDDAIKNSRGFVLPKPEVIRPIYLKLAGVDDPTKPPTAAAKNHARDWLVVPL